MKIIPIVLFLIILTLPAFSNADIAPKGEGYVEYKDNGLNILYCLVNSSEFFTEWAKPQTPFIENISEYIRGDSIFPVIVFGTDNEEDLPNLKLTYNIKIYKPDGSIYGDFKDLPIVDHSVEQYYMYILEQPIVLTIEPDDPLGKYKIDIIIHDVKNSLDIPLSQKFEVKETIERVLFMDTLSEIGNIEVAGDFIAKYYITPRPDLIDDALLVLFDSGFLNGEPDKSSAYGFFSIVFAENNDKINEWKELGKQNKELMKFIKAVEKASRDPKESINKLGLATTTNDIYWSAYFGSGDVYYLKELVNRLKYFEERNDINLFALGGTAAWSLSSNAQQNSRIYVHLVAIMNESEPEMAEKIRFVLENKQEDIMNEIKKIVSEQRNKGVW